MPNPTISAITVSFNSADFIGSAMESVAVQTYDNIEQVIVDGGSKDGTVEIAQKYSRAGSKFVSESDRGIYDAMNKGLALCSGEIVGFVNSDDALADRHVIERLVRKFNSRPDVDLIYGDLLYVDRRRSNVAKRYWRGREFELGDMVKGWAPAHPALFFRRAAIEQVGMFNLDYSLAADFDWMFRALEVRRLSAMYTPLLINRMRTGGATGSGIKSTIKQNKEILTSIRSHGYRTSTAEFAARKVVSRLGQLVGARLHGSAVSAGATK